MTPNFDRLLDLARTEVQTAIDTLPDTLRPAAETVVVTLEPLPNDGLVADGIAPDTLGLFLGESMADPPCSHPQPTQIILFLENLWQFAGHDEAVYLDEVRITYLHELGHYFGFDEDDLEERNLD
jgi:predicted Zn-dependent protease with MMP-like domain